MTRRQAATAVFAVAFVVLGLPDFGHGVTWAGMRGELDRPLADLGTFLAAQAAGYLAVATQHAGGWRPGGGSRGSCCAPP